MKYPEEFQIVVFEHLGKWAADWNFKHDERPFGARIIAFSPDEALSLVVRDIEHCYERLLEQ